MANNQASKVTPKLANQKENDTEMTQLEPDWQITKKCVKERTAVMFNNELLADVHFLVGSGSSQRRIPAHKFILVTGSPVFYAMFYGGLAQDKEEVAIHDVEAEAFLNLLRYLYCDDVSMEVDTILPTLYAAKKYIMPHLSKACVEYLETNIDASNACLLLSQSRIFEEPDLEQRCLDFIDFRGEEALQSDSFSDIDYQTLEQIWSRDTLVAKETSIFAAVRRWAEAECTRQGRDVNPEQCRDVLGDALYLLRFPTMTQHEFADGAAQSGLLNNQEIVGVFFFFSDIHTPKLQFPTIYRKRHDIKICNRYESTKDIGWSFASGNINAIQFSVDKTIYVSGFGQYGATEAAKYHVDMALKYQNGTVLREKRHKMSVDGSCSTTHVLFDCPVKIEADTNYTATFDVDYGGDGHYGVSGMPGVTCDGINFDFKNSGHSKFTGIAQGQIPEILFFH